MDVVMASIYAVCAFAVGFAAGVVSMKLAYRQKEKARLVKEGKALAVKEGEEVKASVLSSGEPEKVDVVEADIKQALD